MLVLQSLHGLRMEETARVLRDRFSWVSRCGLGFADLVSDANILWE
ncbi:MAG: hypothetical protein CMI67_04690 [Pelagibaca sp.]|nr:hypothetical protein [Pelagibaca sp.]